MARTQITSNNFIHWIGRGFRYVYCVSWAVSAVYLSRPVYYWNLQIPGKVGRCLQWYWSSNRSASDSPKLVSEDVKFTELPRLTIFLILIRKFIVL
jgi:hypothetical protein